MVRRADSLCMLFEMRSTEFSSKVVGVLCVILWRGAKQILAQPQLEGGVSGWEITFLKSQTLFSCGK